MQRREHRIPHPFAQADFQIRVGYPTGANLPIKLEITRDEPVIFPTARRDLLHQFDDEALSVQVDCYSLEEIAIEKLRAFLQARRYLETRSWVHRARDLYDIGSLWRLANPPLNWATLRTPLETKARARGVSFTGPADFRDQRVLDAYRVQWEPRLRGFVADLPTFEEALGVFDEVLAAIFR